jgi:hypothetical protein
MHNVSLHLQHSWIDQEFTRYNLHKIDKQLQAAPNYAPFMDVLTDIAVHHHVLDPHITNQPAILRTRIYSPTCPKLHN